MCLGVCAFCKWWSDFVWMGPICITKQYWAYSHGVPSLTCLFSARHFLLCPSWLVASADSSHELSRDHMKTPSSCLSVHLVSEYCSYPLLCTGNNLVAMLCITMMYKRIWLLLLHGGIALCCYIFLCALPHVVWCFILLLVHNSMQGFSAEVPN